ncbi:MULTISPECIES: hypothetical protein [unclassified Mycobacterium]|uniref:hypothetical protein n=1 Tax=unclassified Mycobacterium TaxID=2642494 RepID=UPI0029C96C7E|nr:MULTISPECIES: hypothetical protein [unclassified Mycobacterium]
MGEMLPRIRGAPAASDAACRAFCVRLPYDLPNRYLDVAAPSSLAGFRLWSMYAAAAEDAAADQAHEGDLVEASRALKVAALYRLISSRQSGKPHASAEGRGAAAKDLAAALRFEGTKLTIYEVSVGPWNVTGYLRTSCTTMRTPLVVMLPSAEASAELLYLLFADEFNRAGIACMCIDIAPRAGLQSTAIPEHYLRGGLVRRLLDVATSTIDIATDGATVVDLSNTDLSAIARLAQDSRVSQWVSGNAVFPWSRPASASVAAPAIGVPHLSIHGECDHDHDLLLTLSRTSASGTHSSPTRCDWTELSRRISGWVLSSGADAVLAAAGC